MGIVLWMVLGVMAGSVARRLIPGPDPLGIVGTILLGIAGALLGGTLGVFLGGTVWGYDVRCLILALTGALVLLFGYRPRPKAAPGAALPELMPCPQGR